MPWVMRKNDSGKTCVYKEGSDGQPMGEPLGCHATEAEAKQQMAALYANIHKAVKFADGSEDVVEGPGMPFGGPFSGSDLDGQRFTAKTDFAFSWFGEGARPLLYHHGLDGDAGTDVVGRVKAWEVKTDLGVWTQAQLDKQSKYFAAIKEMIAAGKLYFSSGAMAHLVEVGKSGDIKRWPWVELSLTPTPSNLLATVDLATAEKHYKSAGLSIPDLLKMPKPMMHQMMAEMASEMGIEMSEDEMAAMIAALDSDMPEAEMRKKLQMRKQRMSDSDHKATDLDSLSIVDHAILTERYAASLSQRTKDLRERRTKEGRVLSTMNRKRLTECVASMRMAMGDLQGLLDQTEPAKAVNLLRLRAQLEASRLHSLTIS